MSTTGDKIAAAADAMVGVPFRHQGRNPRSGLDCVGVVLCAVWAAGCDVPDCVGYGPLPRTEVLMQELAARTKRVHLDDANPGDILLFQYRPDMPMHFAILLPNHFMVHAHNSTGKVVKHRLSVAWTKRLHSIWRTEKTHG